MDTLKTVLLVEDDHDLLEVVWRRWQEANPE